MTTATTRQARLPGKDQLGVFSFLTYACMHFSSMAMVILWESEYFSWPSLLRCFSVSFTHANECSVKGTSSKVSMMKMHWFQSNWWRSDGIFGSSHSFQLPRIITGWIHALWYPSDFYCLLMEGDAIGSVLTLLKCLIRLPYRQVNFPSYFKSGMSILDLHCEAVRRWGSLLIGSPRWCCGLFIRKFLLTYPCSFVSFAVWYRRTRSRTVLGGEQSADSARYTCTNRQESSNRSRRRRLALRTLAHSIAGRSDSSGNYDEEQVDQSVHHQTFQLPSHHIEDPHISEDLSGNGCPINESLPRFADSTHTKDQLRRKSSEDTASKNEQSF